MPGSALLPMVVELKWDKPGNAAIEQIKLRKYPAALSSLEGGCLLAGITYHEESTSHECHIERIEL